MKKILCISWVVMTLLLAGACAGYADPGRHGGRGGGGAYDRSHVWHGGSHGGRGGGVDVWIGPGRWPGWWGPTYPYYVTDPYYRYYPEYAAPPVVIQQPAEEYVQPAEQLPTEPSYWYYCRNPQGYYPYVKQCPNGWMKVVPSPPPGQ